MTDAQWQELLRIVHGDLLDPLPVGLIIDSPWLPGWGGVSILDYLGDEQAWLRLNLEAAQRFDKIHLLPGFWAEYGMCTEPSAFGVKCIWYKNAFPSVERNLHGYEEISRVKKPNCKTDGLGPFVLQRLQRTRREIEAAGHRIRFATARGPLNIASYLLGHTEFLIGLKTNPDDLHRLLTIVTDYLVDWISLQAETFDSIDGIFLLDDLIGFLGNDDFEQFALPYLKRIYDSHPAAVRFLHNDAPGMITASHLAAIGVNLFNFSFRHGLKEMREAAGPSVVLLGNVPPRDVLAGGSPDDVRRAVGAMFDGVEDRRRIIVSCGGGTSPDTSTANIEALLDATRHLESAS